MCPPGQQHPRLNYTVSPAACERQFFPWLSTSEICVERWVQSAEQYHLQTEKQF